MKKVKILKFILIILFLQNNFASQKADSDFYSLYKMILKKYVVNGLVNYKNLKTDVRLQDCINILANIDPSNIKGRNSLLAFWINVYNAYTLKIICDNYPLKSITELSTSGKEKTSIWDKQLVIVNNKKLSLNDIENKIIRKKYKDLRIHFALVCAAISCPELRNEPYTSANLYEQLNDQGKKFFVNSSKNNFDLRSKTAYLSRILDWYRNDFGKNNSEIFLSISEFLPEKVAAEIKNSNDKWNIKFKNYNWSLNEIN